jgi:outer membrane biogenesis lipoprotein LolB
MRNRGLGYATLLVALATSALTGCSGDTERPADARHGTTSGTALWKPRPGLAWQWQLDGRVDPSADVPVYDIDGFENSARPSPGCTPGGAR